MTHIFPGGCCCAPATSDPENNITASAIIDLIKRIVTVSVETNRIVAGLPALEIVE